MALKAWLNQNLVIKPIFGQTLNDFAIPISDDEGVIVLNDSTINYAFCKRSKTFNGEIVVGKVHQISYDLVCDRGDRIWIRIINANAMDIEIPKSIDYKAVLPGDMVKDALKKRTMAATTFSVPCKCTHNKRLTSEMSNWDCCSYYFQISSDGSKCFTRNNNKDNNNTSSDGQFDFGSSKSFTTTYKIIVILIVIWIGLFK